MSKFEPITTKHLILREIEWSDTDFIIQLRTDNENGSLSRKEDISPEIHNQWLRKYFCNNNDYYFIIIDKESHQSVGSIALFDIDRVSKKAEYGRIILQKKYRTYTVEALIEVLKLGFERMLLNKIYCYVREDNFKAVKFHYSLGLNCEGNLKKHYWNGEFFSNLMVFSIFHEQFKDKCKKYYSSGIF